MKLRIILIGISSIIIPTLIYSNPLAGGAAIASIYGGLPFAIVAIPIIIFAGIEIIILHFVLPQISLSRTIPIILLANSITTFTDAALIMQWYGSVATLKGYFWGVIGGLWLLTIILTSAFLQWLIIYYLLLVFRDDSSNEKRARSVAMTVGIPFGCILFFILVSMLFSFKR